MKRSAILLSLMVLLSIATLAQNSEKPYSLVAHVGGGSGSFPFLDGDMTTSHRIAALGIDGKYDFAEHWSLLVGLDYQFWYFKGYYIHSDPDGVENLPYTATGHIMRLPIRLEYHKRWFYMAFGPYLEKAFGDVSAGSIKEIATLGPTMEIGGRIRLSDNGKLRIGLQTSVGTTLSIGYHKELFFGRVEANALLRIGYEYHF